MTSTDWFSILMFSLTGASLTVFISVSWWATTKKTVARYEKLLDAQAETIHRLTQHACAIADAAYNVVMKCESTQPKEPQ